jgi:hypothetical protein
LNGGRIYDLIGHAFGLLSAAKPKRVRGIYHYQSDLGLAHLVLTKRGYGAITFGHVVISSQPLDEHCWRHELAHVAQYDWLGLFFVPLYLWYQARHGYANNPLELEAEARAREGARDVT